MAWTQCPITLANQASATRILPSQFPYFSASMGVTVSATLNNVPTLGNTSYTCGPNNYACGSTAWWPNASNSTITLTFSAPVTNFSVVVNGTNQTELFTFTANTGTISLSNYCTAGFVVQGAGNQLLYNVSTTGGGLITVNNSTPATTYTIAHNGLGSGSRLSLLDCFSATVLPAEMASFDAAYNLSADATRLDWETASEYNCEGFEVQHSLDGEAWAMLGTVPSAGNSSQPLSYNHMHRNPAEGANFYRLRQYDVDGHYTYTEVREVVVPSKGDAITVFPNPSTGQFEVRASGRKGVLTVTDLVGKTLYVAAFEDVRTMDLSGHPAGVYLVELVDQNLRKSTQRLVLR